MGYKAAKNLLRDSTGQKFWKNLEIAIRHKEATYGDHPVLAKLWYFWGNHFTISDKDMLADYSTGAYQREIITTNLNKNFEELAYEYLSDRGQAAISSSSHKKELLAISDSFMTQVTPDEVKHITYQPRIRKGQLANVNMEDNDGLLGNMAAGMTPDEAKKHGTTLDKVMSTLDALGATKRTRRKPIKYTPHLYD